MGNAMPCQLSRSAHHAAQPHMERMRLGHVIVARCSPGCSRLHAPLVALCVEMMANTANRCRGAVRPTVRVRPRYPRLFTHQQ